MNESIVIEAPNPLKFKKDHVTVFLAGSIEMGKAKEWQKEIIEKFKNKSVTFFNPRRKDWDSSWKQTKEDKNFSQQVNWELEALEVADVILMYFDPDTDSVITLLEMGVHIRDPRLIVCCEEGYYRKGNVDITCEKYGTKQVDSIEALEKELDKLVNE